ncbi:MAG: alpha/beta fold hydrolase [Spirochaetaceae bacterium]|nr:alpha/beta fold hydrolase [Spirochaetaceae bacterium]
MSGANLTRRVSEESSPTAVLLHGFLGEPADWQPVIDRLAGRLQCVAPPLVEHPTLASLETAIRRAVPGPAVLIGYSMGARLALHLLLRDPNRYRAGVLACGSPGIPTATGRAERRRGDACLAARLRGLDGGDALRGFLDDWYAQPIFARVRSHPCYQAMLARRLRIDRRAWAATLTHLGTGALPPLWDELPRLRQPTLVVAGTLDDRYVSITARMEERNDAIRARLLTDCGHAVLCEKPAEFATQASTFLDEELRST